MNEIRCRKLDCAKELAAVPIQEIAKIAAALARNPGSAAVKDGLQKKDSDDGNTAPGEAMTKKRRKRRERVDERDPLVEATAKTFELLEIVYQEKCRKSRESRCQELAALPIVEVAKIAVTFMCDGNTPPVEATAKALELLEIAYYGKFGLAGKDSYEAGLKDFVRDRKLSEQFHASIAKIPEWEWQKGSQPFEKGLEALMPLPGYGTARARGDRMRRFTDFLKDMIREERPGLDEPQITIEAETRIAKMKQDGIPARLFRQTLLWFHIWWKKQDKERHSKAGKKGGQKERQTKPARDEKIEEESRESAAKAPSIEGQKKPQVRVKGKGKQGRVKSESDKRKGARPPEEPGGNHRRGYLT